MLVDSPVSLLHPTFLLPGEMYRLQYLQPAQCAATQNGCLLRQPFLQTLPGIIVLTMDVVYPCSYNGLISTVPPLSSAGHPCASVVASSMSSAFTTINPPKISLISTKGPSVTTPPGLNTFPSDIRR